MTKIKHFFVGILLLIVTFFMVICAAFIYRANENMSIRSYIFQMNYLKSQRVGALQNINDMSAVDLRNKLIKKYVAEYFKVIPGIKNLTNNSVLETMSDTEAYKYWKTNMAPEISKMSAQGKFRLVMVPDDGIAAVDLPKGYDYYNAVIPRPVFYSVKYYTLTWDESNFMAVEPKSESGIIYIQAIFKPGIWEKIPVGIYTEPDKKDIKYFNIQEYLESGLDPVNMFKFVVSDIDDGKK